MTSTELIAHARTFLYVREKTANSSPEIDAWLHRVGQPPGVSWCAAFAFSMVKDVDPTNPLRPSASALHLLANNLSLQVKLNDLQPGDIVIYDEGEGLGHVAIATNVVVVNDQLGAFDTIAGNTSADGKSRNGDRVAEHEASLEKLAGILRVCSELLIS